MTIVHDLLTYREKFNLQKAQFQLIKQDDATNATIYKVIVPCKKPLILKICSRSEDYLRELHFIGSLYDWVLIPRIIQTIDPSIDLRGAILMEYIEGHSIQDTDWTNELAFEIGKSLACLHQNVAFGYGDPIKQDPFKGYINVPVYPELYFKYKLEKELDECLGYLPFELIEQCKQYYNNHIHLLTKVDGACMIHGDFHPENLIVHEGKLKGIINWAKGFWGFAEQEFCQIEHFKWFVNPEHKKSFLEGYSSRRPIPNYQRIIPLLQLERALAVIRDTIASQICDNSNATLYNLNREFLDNFDFSS